MKAIVLFSSGIDSPVAAKICSDKGIELIGLHFCKSDVTKEYIFNLKALAEKSGIKKLYFADKSYYNEEYQRNCHTRFQCVFCKRMMLRIAEKLAEKEDYKFIVTGDNISQVASQTIENMQVISEAIKSKDIIILSPILTNEKNETINIAREIGTYEFNLKFKETCTFLPKSPATKSKLEIIKKEEAKLDIEQLVQKTLDSFRLILE